MSDVVARGARRAASATHCVKAACVPIRAVVAATVDNTGLHVVIVRIPPIVIYTNGSINSNWNGERER